MITTQAKKLIVIAIIVGFVGDAIWQVLTKVGYGNSLEEYFNRQGRAEAMFTAAGIMGIFYFLYALTGLPFKLQWLALYGLLIDQFARHTHIFPSLDSYYQKQKIWESGIGGGIIPFILPLLVLKAIDPKVSII